MPRLLDETAGAEAAEKEARSTPCQDRPAGGRQRPAQAAWDSGVRAIYGLAIIFAAYMLG
jgi:hypothetical protein